MLIFLPERLYDFVKDDEEYHTLVEKHREKIFYETDFLNMCRKYDSIDPDVIEIIDLLKTKIPDEYQLALSVALSEDPIEYEDRFDEMDVETKIFYLYACGNGDMTWDDEAEKRNQLCIQLYEENILDKEVGCSLFIHTIYYFRKVYELIWKYTNRKRNLIEFENFKKEEMKIFDKMIIVSDNESFQNIMFSKRQQMYVLYLLMVGQFCEERTKMFNSVRDMMNNTIFKYNTFSYFKLEFYLICFQEYMDAREVYKAKQCLDNLIELITYAYDNKQEAVDSLNHFNKKFMDDFLVLSKFIYFMVSKYMPNLNKKWNFLKHENMKPAEYRYYNNTLNNKDREIVKNFNVNDRYFSYAWLPSNNYILNIIDQMVV